MGGRSTRSTARAKRWISPDGATKQFWNLDCLHDGQPSETDTLIISQGELDGVALLSAGYRYVVSVPNGANRSEPDYTEEARSDPNAHISYLFEDGNVLPVLARFPKIILATDGDDRGKALAKTLAYWLSAVGCHRGAWPTGTKDANDVLMKFPEDGTKRLCDLIEAAEPLCPYYGRRPSDIAPKPQRQLMRFAEDGWSDVILSRPELVVVTGRPSDGKSTWVRALLCRLAHKYAVRSLVIGPEDDKDYVKWDLRAFARSVGREPAWIDEHFHLMEDDYVRLTQEFVLGQIEVGATRHGVQLVCIDPWNELEHQRDARMTETEYSCSLLMEMKALARRLNIIVLIVAHPAKPANNAKQEDRPLFDLGVGPLLQQVRPRHRHPAAV
jgi:twinkle protein